MTALVAGSKAAGVSQQKNSHALNMVTIHNEATIIRLAVQGHTNEAIATLTVLAEQYGVANLVEERDRSGGNHRREMAVRCTYPGRQMAEAGLPGAK